MIPQKIEALFNFIEYLDENKIGFIEKYIPLCNELTVLDTQRAKLKPNNNYLDKQQYDKLQNVIAEKFNPIEQNIKVPVLRRLKELGIWAGDDVYTSIWNDNISAISDFKKHFTTEDVSQVMNYKQKYLNFRIETNTDFLCLKYVFSNLDEIFKQLFDFFKDTDKNEFDSFETKTIEVNTIEDAVKGFMNTKGKNVRFSFPNHDFFKRPDETIAKTSTTNIFNEITMGNKIQVGDISNNSGQIIIGENIRVSDSLNGQNETAEKISELINLIRKEQNINEEQKQSLITNFDKVKDEVYETQPAKPKIFKWLNNTKEILETLVLTHDVTEAVHWVYENLNFIVHQIKG